MALPPTELYSWLLICHRASSIQHPESSVSLTTHHFPPTHIFPFCSLTFNFCVVPPPSLHVPRVTSNEGQPTKTPSFSRSRPPFSGLLCARWHYHLLNSTLGSSSAIEHRVSSIQNLASHSLLTIHYSSITTFSHLLLGGIDTYQPPPIQQ